MSDGDGNDQPLDFSARIKFSDFTKYLEKIHNAKSTAEKEDKLKRFIGSISEFRKKFIAEEGPDVKASFYPILRLILPKKDSERAAHGIRRKRLGDLLVKALAISEHSSTGRLLTGAEVSPKGDFGDVVFNVMKDRKADGTLTIYEVNECLDILAAKTKGKDSDLAYAIRKMSAVDCKWFTRIILKKLSLGVGLGFKRIMQLYHPKALICYYRYSLLSRTCEIIDSGEEIEEQCHIEIFKPIAPMLCERGKIADINEILSEDDYFMETKMDGERIHIHISGNKYHYFSRSCNDDSTKVFGGDSTSGIFSPNLHRLLRGKFESAIFDGEMMVWNRTEKTYVTKTEKATARFLSVDDPNLSACYCVYDLIYLDGKSLLNIPYAERIRKLRSLVTETPGQLTLCNRVEINDAEHFLECVNKAFDDKEEGVVIKGADTIYKPGKREGGGWFKIKPDYEDNLVADFDLLVIGGYYNGKRTMVHKFLLGVCKKDNFGGNDKFFAVTSVIHGFTRQQLESIHKKLEPYWQVTQTSKFGRASTSRAPDYIEWNKAVPDVWIEPKNSIVLQIKAADLSITNWYRTKYTFRFPRVMAVRYDKPWTDCCTLSEFEKCCPDFSKPEKLTKRPATIEDIDNNESRSKRKKTKATESAVNGRAAVPKEEVHLVDNVCAGLEFCILNAGKYKEVELENIIRKHGGLVVKNPGPKTYACIADGSSYRVKTAVSSGKYNIATADWLFRSFGVDSVLKFLPKFHPKKMIHTKADLQLKFVDYFDTFGDSFSEEGSKDELKELCAKLDIATMPVYTKSELYELETELWAPQEPPKLFRFLTASFQPMQNSDDSEHNYKLAQFMFTTKAGRILNTNDDNSDSLSKLTHIFVNDKVIDSTQIDSWKRSQVHAHIKVLSYKWILECCEANRKIDDQRFICG